MSYFSYFPTTPHSLTNNGQTVQLTNILRRFKVKSSLTDIAGIYYEYDIQAGDRPDTIAAKYYGSPNYAWIVLHFNNIIDPIFDWPLFNSDFDNYIYGKYGSPSIAQATIHEYRHILNAASVRVGGQSIPKRWLVVDLTTYNTLPALDKETVTKYDYEIELNEEKRKIKILDKRYLQQIRDEVKDILKNGV